MALVFVRAETLIWQLRRDALTGMESDSQVVGDVLAAQTSRYLQLVDAGLRRIQAAGASLPGDDPGAFLARFGGEDTRAFLRESLAYLPQTNAFLMIDSQGTLISTTREGQNPPTDESDRSYYRAFLDPDQSDPFISPPAIGRATGVPVIFMARRIKTADGKFAGVAVAVLDVGYFRKFYESLNIGVSRGVTLLRRDGTILVRFPEAEPTGIELMPDLAAWSKVVAAGGGMFRSTASAAQSSDSVSVHPLVDCPLVIDVSLREGAALAPWQGLIRLILVQSVVAAVGIVLVFYVIVRQLRRLRDQNRALTEAGTALRESEQRLRAYAEMASDWLWEQDENLRFSWTSPTSPSHRVGLTSDGMTRWGQVGADPTDPAWADHVADLQAHRPFRDFRYARVDTGGEIRHMSISGTPVLGPDGAFAGYRGTGRDVTAEVAAARELRDARDRAEAANKAKSEFLANMSHELRTPLNAIIGFSELIAGQAYGQLERRYVDFANDILSGGRHLLDLINDLLDMSKIEAGQFELEEEPVKMAPLIQSCLSMVRTRAAMGNVRLTVAESLPAYEIRADCRAVRQIMLNLLSNAVKFTHAGGSVALWLESADGGMAFVVQDTGIGIAEDALARLGEPFQQADASISRRFGGTGLGLAITQKLMVMHGGSIRFESEVGRGTTVRAIFPAERIIRTG